MKEATGELSTTVIAVVAIAAVLAIFTAFLLPSMKSSIRAKTYCSSAVNCTECVASGTNGDQGTQKCHYYEDDMTISTNEITCDCTVTGN